MGVNVGTCKDCNKNSKELAKERSERFIAMTSKRERALCCPECGGELRVKQGRYGDFYGCSNFPSCRFTSPMRKQYQNIS
ncbi:MAG: topoisomerase DNA-binding C4 zinc finger domain-containing protein [Lachnospiraceae bacterium]|nr:topoisomerase DNA-binding C4 zinc finger domain-containing protein [Lachnospiraceae bacterium]